MERYHEEDENTISRPNRNLGADKGGTPAEAKTEPQMGDWRHRNLIAAQPLHRLGEIQMGRSEHDYTSVKGCHDG